jgi:hypothetical protein
MWAVMWNRSQRGRPPFFGGLGRMWPEPDNNFWPTPALSGASYPVCAGGAIAAVLARQGSSTLVAPGKPCDPRSLNLTRPSVAWAYGLSYTANGFAGCGETYELVAYPGPEATVGSHRTSVRNRVAFISILPGSVADDFAHLCRLENQPGVLQRGAPSFSPRQLRQAGGILVPRLQ